MEMKYLYESNMKSIRHMLTKFIDNDNEILVSVKNIYNPLPSEIIKIDKLFDHFALCHSVRSGLPYTLTYNALIMHDYELFAPDDMDIKLYEDGKELIYQDGKRVDVK